MHTDAERKYAAKAARVRCVSREKMNRLPTRLTILMIVLRFYQIQDTPEIILQLKNIMD